MMSPTTNVPLPDYRPELGRLSCSHCESWFETTGNPESSWRRHLNAAHNWRNYG